MLKGLPKSGKTAVKAKASSALGRAPVHMTTPLLLTQQRQVVACNTASSNKSGTRRSSVHRLPARALAAAADRPRALLLAM